MRATSVRELKDELKDAPVVPTAFARSLGLGSADALVERLAGAHTRDVGSVSVALGIAPGRRAGDFRLGARIHRTGPAAEKLAAALQEKARGEADVRVVPRVTKRAPRPAWFRRRHRPLEAGLSIGHVAITAGTLGFVVEDRDGTYVLSNNHVLADVNQGNPGDLVVQPGPADARPVQANLVAVLDRFVSISFQRSNLVDCAVAALLDDQFYFHGWTEALPGRVHGAADLTIDDLGRRVKKAGRTTGVTSGVVTQVEVDRLRVNMGDERRPKIAVFSDQIEVQGDGGAPFSLGGDSGSLIVDEAGTARALLFAGGEDEGGVDLTFGNRIESVLEKLGVSLAL